MAAQHTPHRTLILADVSVDDGGETMELIQRAVVAADRTGGIDAVALCGKLPADLNAAEIAIRDVIGELVEGVPVLTAPRDDHVGCLAVSPFPYAIVTEGSGPEHHQLVNDIPDLFDTHIHSQLAYCATTANVAGAAARAQRFGLAGICFTEHAGQLYVEANDFWSARFIHEPNLWKRAADSRIDIYRELTDPVRSAKVLVGFETELDCDGALILHEEDRRRADILLGAVHWLNVDPDGLTDRQFEAAFLRQAEQLLATGVDVMAHPVRLFWRGKRPLTDDLCPSVAKMLAAAGVVAEINIHKNDPADVFVDACLNAGAAITFGSDSHAIHQVGNFGPHQAMLRRLTGVEDISPLLWRPDARGQ